MSNLFITFFAYLIDKKFGEFTFIKHPIIIIGEIISFFEKHFYKNSVLQGCLLVVFVLGIVTTLSMALTFLLQLFPFFLTLLFTSLIASMFIAHKMLRDAVGEILHVKNKKEAIAMLVSRDTKDMSESDVYKAAIETYAENLSDGVIAPLFYLLLFNLAGIVIYKAINTMDSMVGYRNERYEKFGKCAARLDDLANYIPSRLTALLIMLLGKEKDVWQFYDDGRKHESPNAGHPITAMALVLDVKLGGDTSYFGKVKHKAHFGEGRAKIRKEDVQNALKLL